jgi:Flp pilus assembly protein CpaB
MLAIFLVLLLFGALGVMALTIWLARSLLSEDEAEMAREEQPLSIAHIFARELEARRMWRALSSWISGKPLRLEDKREPD